MRIGMMVDAYKPHISGVTNSIAINKKQLETLGHEVFIFTFGGLDYPDDESNVIRSPGVALTGSGYSVGPGYTRKAQKLLAAVDVAHVHHPFVSGQLALRYCKPPRNLRRIPILCTNHTRYDLYTRVYFSFLPYQPAVWLINRYLTAFYRACDLVIAPSAGLRDVLRRAGIDAPVEVVPNGVDLQPFLAVRDPVQRADLGLGEADVLLIFVGRVGKEKNMQFLLRAFAAAQEQAAQLRLLIVGEGPERESLQTWVNERGLGERVRFTGQIPYAEIPRYMAAADVFATASVTEVHPLTVIEAMAAGLPVLGIHSPGVSDTVADGVSGLICAEELSAYTANLLRIASNKELRQRLAAQARQASQAYAIENTAAILLSHYQRLVEKAEQVEV